MSLKRWSKTVLPYRTKFIFLYGDKESYIKFSNRFFGESETELMPGLDGQCGYNDDTGTYYVWINEFEARTKDFNALAHEALHATAHMLGPLGIKFETENHEAYAYLFGELYGWCLEKILSYRKDLGLEPEKKQNGKTAEGVKFEDN